MVLSVKFTIFPIFDMFFDNAPISAPSPVTDVILLDNSTIFTIPDIP